MIILKSSIRNIYGSNRYLLQTVNKIPSFQRNIYLERFKSITHYEVLGVNENCSQEEIKNAFIVNSKQFHPDKNPNECSSKKFVAINEAYSVLGKFLSRKDYDNELSSHRSLHSTNMYRYSSNIYTDAPRERVIFRDPSFWGNRDKSKDQTNDNNYEWKMSNGKTAFGCLVFMVFGAVIQYLFFKLSSVSIRNHLDEKTRAANNHYLKVKNQAMHNGQKKQIELFNRKGNCRMDD